MGDLPTKEIWKNVAAGPRHYLCLNAIGEQTTKVVQPNRTFTVSVTERRLNQEAVYDPKADPFRDGTFLMVRDTENTESDEIDSPNSVTDDEIEKAVREALGGDPVPVEMMLERIDSINTANRIYEELVAEDASHNLVEMAKAKVDEFTERPIGNDGEPITVGQRETVTRAVEMAGTGTKKDWKTKVE
jgi:hypothetical protein